MCLCARVRTRASARAFRFLRGGHWIPPSSSSRQSFGRSQLPRRRPSRVSSLSAREHSPPQLYERYEPRGDVEPPPGYDNPGSAGAEDRRVYHVDDTVEL